MKHTKQEAIQKIRETGDQIVQITEGHKRAYNELLSDVHYYVYNSDITYSEVFAEIKNIAKTKGDFNSSMGRMRETICDRDKRTKND